MASCTTRQKSAPSVLAGAINRRNSTDGYYVEWYVDDDNSSGLGNNKQVAFWEGRNVFRCCCKKGTRLRVVNG
jgi:hypothetical protein